MEILIILALLIMFIGFIFKLSFSIVKLALYIIAFALIMVVLPVGLVLAVPLGLLLLAVGFLRIIF